MVEFKAFCSLDGIGLRLLNQFNIVTGVITGRESPGTEERLSEYPAAPSGNRGPDWAYGPGCSGTQGAARPKD